MEINKAQRGAGAGAGKEKEEGSGGVRWRNGGGGVSSYWSRQAGECRCKNLKFAKDG